MSEYVESQTPATETEEDEYVVTVTGYLMDWADNFTEVETNPDDVPEEFNHKIIGYVLGWEVDGDTVYGYEEETKAGFVRRNSSADKHRVELMPLNKLFHFVKCEEEEYRYSLKDTYFIPQNWNIIPFYSYEEFDDWKEGK